MVTDMETALITVLYKKITKNSETLRISIKYDGFSSPEETVNHMQVTFMSEFTYLPV